MVAHLLMFAAAAMLLAGAAPATAPVGNAAATWPVAAKKAVVIPLSGEVDDFNRSSLEKRFAAAKAEGAQVVILKIDTYGGLVTAGLDISRFIKNQTQLHTIAYVDTKAISAGAMIAMACNEIVMADDAVIGDCADRGER